jgi:hypothetical protein
MRARVRHNLSSRLSAAKDPVIPMSAGSCDHVTTLRIWEDARVGLEDLRLAFYYYNNILLYMSQRRQ